MRGAGRRNERYRISIRLGRALLLLAVAVVAAPLPSAAQALAPSDTLHVRLLDRIANHPHRDRAVRALVIAPVVDDRGTIVPPGSIVSGYVDGAGMEHVRGSRHWLALRLDSLSIPIDDSANRFANGLTSGAASDSARASVALRVVAIDDARESVDTTGRIVGPPSHSMLHEKRNWVLAAVGVLHPVSALIVAATLQGETAERHRALSLPAGTELTVVVTQRSMLPSISSWSPPPPVAGDIDADSIAASAPLRAQLRTHGIPSDVVGVAIIGSAAQLRAAFAAAGWTRAAPMNVGSNVVTFVKAAEGEGYAAQPVSELVLRGRDPAYVYEKVADTFLKRHHFRVWRWPAGYASDSSTSLWLIAATHDTGLMWSKQLHAFTHVVDPRIDLERDKIVSDLVAANAVRAMSYATRSAPAGGATVNGGRASAISDWRMAVMVLR